MKLARVIALSEMDAVIKKKKKKKDYQNETILPIRKHKTRNITSGCKL